MLNKQVNKTGHSIIKTGRDIAAEEQKLKNLKDEYSKMIYAAFKKNGKRNDLMFVISANNFNQPYKRILYLKQYSKFRKTQASTIEEAKELLINKKEKLAQQKDRLSEESAIKIFLVESKKEYSLL